MWPRVHDNDACTYEPVTRDEQVEKGDIVFCEVQPKGHFYAHLVQRKEWDYSRKAWKFTISNAKTGKGYVENGWAYIDTIYGKLVSVMH